MKSWLLQNSVGMIVMFLVGLDKDHSEVKKYGSILIPLRDALLQVYPVK